MTSCARRPETPGSVTTVMRPAGGFAADSISTASFATPRPNSARSRAFTSSHPTVPSQIVRGFAAVTFSGDGLAGDPDADLPPLQAGAPGVRELERPVGVGI